VGHAHAYLDVAAVKTAKSGSPAPADHGCISYELFASESKPGAFATVEKWESQVDSDAHMVSPHIAEMITWPATISTDPSDPHPPLAGVVAVWLRQVVTTVTGNRALPGRSRTEGNAGYGEAGALI
jgi:quinol monooxygenase YgiN